MIQFLASAVVVLALVVIVIAAWIVNRVLREFATAEAMHRLERAAVMRALVARNSGELVHLDRTAGQAEAARVGSTAKDTRRSVSEDEWAAIVRADMERVNGVGQEFVPSVPEGL